jgi:hypothetical protein
MPKCDASRGEPATPAPAALRFAGYVEPDEPGWDDLLEAARDRMRDRLLRARSRDELLALAPAAARHGLTVEATPEDGDGFGGWAA